MKKRKKTPILLWIAIAAFAMTFVVSSVLLVRELKQTKQEADTFAELANLRGPRGTVSSGPTATPAAASADQPTGTARPVMEIIIEIPEDPAAQPTVKMPVQEEPAEEQPAETSPMEASPQAAEPVGDPTPLPQYVQLYELNHDFFGWISIPDTRVDYPVMYNAKNPLAYLGHDFYGKFSYAGVPYLDSDCDPDGDFYLVYGHRMNDGSMFADLVAYEDQSFWETHRTFSFDTLCEERTYEVVFAIKARVLDKDERYGFRYYNYTSLDTETEFDDYMEQARELACYDTGVEAAFGDELLVLSTCYHYTRDGRFVLIAKRVTA